jgi:DNA repair protein RecN (Recombination protein N)
MLLELRAENYAVIDRTSAQFGPGLNLLTGETGAGKSILIDALALLLGGKASSDFVRHGAEKAVVSCVFEATPGACDLLAHNGIDSEDDQIVLRREVTAAGKGRVFINNQPASVATLRLLAPELALVHAQGETLGAFDQAQQRALLDRYANANLEPVRKAWTEWRAVQTRLEVLLADEQDRLRMADMWRFQVKEIEQASIAPVDEDTHLEAEKRILANAEKLYASAVSANDLLYEAEDSAETTLGKAVKLVEELARYDLRFVQLAQDLVGAKAVVEDISTTLRDFAATVQAGPERLAEIEDRLAILDRLKRKYGATLAEVTAFGEEAARQLAEVDNRDALLAELRAEEVRSAQQYEAAAGGLSAVRTQAARKLSKAAEAEINSLAMQVRFAVNIEPERDRASWSVHGWDQMSYQIATNAGEPLKNLNEIASGGELSRVMLALKVTIEEAVSGRGGQRGNTLPRTLVFDEIDIGIGGRAAEAVGKKLKALSRNQQVLCITHLPQIASFADQHFAIEKRESKGRTQTEIRRMDRPERVQEVARMLSGAILTDTSLRHAEQLIDAAAAF